MAGESLKGKRVASEYRLGTWNVIERWVDRKPRPVPEPKLGIGVTKDMLMGAGRPVVRNEQCEEIA